MTQSQERCVCGCYRENHEYDPTSQGRWLGRCRNPEHRDHPYQSQREVYNRTREDNHERRIQRMVEQAKKQSS